MTFNLISIILILYLQPENYSMNYIHTIINGSLANNISFTVGVYAEAFEGVILNVVDSDRNKLIVRVSLGFNDEKFIRITHNEVYKDAPLINICGCADCKGENTLSVRMYEGMVNVSCNLVSHTAIAGQKNNRNKTGKYIPIPKLLANTKGQMYIMMGNIGPSTDDQNKIIYPVKDQLIGCLHKFNLNDTTLQFNITNSIDDKPWEIMMPNCVQKCPNRNICNKGQCQEAYTRIFCNCSLTSLNGQFCNDSLKSYVDGASNSYISMKGRNILEMKMTWKQGASNTRFCLLEFRNNGSDHVLLVDKNMLIMDRMMVLELDSNEIHFVFVVVEKDRLVYKIANLSYTLEFIVSDTTRVNVGFSERIDICGTFTGLFDFVSSDLDKLSTPDVLCTSSTKSVLNVTIEQTGLYNVRVSQSLDSAFNSQTVVIGSVIACILIINVIVVISILCRRKLAKREVDLEEFSAYDDYCQSVNNNYKDYSTIDLEEAYQTGDEAYNNYNRSSLYSNGYSGPQLPPRDENSTVELTDINRSSGSFAPTVEYNHYQHIQYDGTYGIVQDDPKSIVDRADDKLSQF